MDADLTQFMEETSGLGQATLLPATCAEGLVEGQVGYSFGRTGSLWAVDTRVRLEDAELIGFELLQNSGGARIGEEIPDDCRCAGPQAPVEPCPV